jgi:hypothetical protein
LRNPSKVAGNPQVNQQVWIKLEKIAGLTTAGDCNQLAGRVNLNRRPSPSALLWLIILIRAILAISAA